MTGTITRHRKKNPQRCQRCPRLVDAEWNLAPEGKSTMFLCETHARYWAAQYDIDFPETKEKNG